MSADLARDTAVTRLEVAPGWYTAELSTAWDFRTPSGGVLMTVAMRAMQLELNDPRMRPVSAHTHFCSPVPAGPLQVRVDVLRHGGVAAQVRAQLSSTAVPGPGLEVSATFGIDRADSIDLIDAEPPVLPRPDESLRFGETTTMDRQDSPRFFSNFDSRLAEGHIWWRKGWPAGPARIARWFRYLVPQHLPDGRFDPLALPPIADTMPPAIVQKLGPDHEPFFAPSLDLTVHFIEDTQREWILTRVHSRRARAGYATADVEIWDDEGRLVAMATQMMLMRRAKDRP
jgi:acyl-CoA thioesterase